METRRVRREKIGFGAERNGHQAGYFIKSNCLPLFLYLLIF